MCLGAVNLKILRKGKRIRCYASRIDYLPPETTRPGSLTDGGEKLLSSESIDGSIEEVKLTKSESC